MKDKGYGLALGFMADIKVNCKMRFICKNEPSTGGVCATWVAKCPEL